MKTRLLQVLLLVLFTAGFIYAGEIPVDGIRAEESGRWTEALDIYYGILSAEPDRADLWLRVADIHYELDEKIEAAEALEKAAELRNESGLYSQASRAYADAGYPGKALANIEKALETRPGDEEYLLAAAELALWNGRYEEAARYYRKTAAEHGEKPETTLGLARALTRSGELDESAVKYSLYLEKRPEDDRAFIEYVRAETWRGNYKKALKLLEDYRGGFGKTHEYRKTKAMILAQNQRPDEAFEILDSLPSEESLELEALYTRAVSFFHQRRYRDALNALESLRAKSPESALTRGAGLFIKTPLRSFVTVGGDYGEDSDEIEHYRYFLEGELFAGPRLSFPFSLETHDLDTEPGTGLDAIGPEDGADYDAGLIGLKYVGGPAAVELLAGAGDTGDDSSFVYSAELDIRAADFFEIAVSAGRDHYTVSPRSVDLDIRRTSGKVKAFIGYPHSCYLNLEAGYEDFSDGNEKREIIFAPAMAVLRREHFNLDAGLKAWAFEFEKDLNHGYYDPDRFERYAVELYGYFKINENNGIGIVLSPGFIKDDSMDDFESGFSGSIEGAFGIYGDWMLKALWSHVQNSRVGTGAFRANKWTISLTRRF